MRAYYNEIDLDAAAILQQLIDENVIAPGDVDTRSIRDVQPDDLHGYTQCHFFAGGGLWSVAARLAGWSDDRPLWTGSCPCQPYSSAGKLAGADDPRHLWPDFHRLIRAARPSVVMGEQVAGAPGYGWFDGVRSDLEGEGYASRAVDIPACAVDAPHQRGRLYWCAVANGVGATERGYAGDARSAASQGEGAPRAADGHPLERCDDARRRGHDDRGSHADLLQSDADGRGRDGREEASQREALERAVAERDLPRRNGSFWSDHEWIACHDGKARRSQPGLPLLVDGLPGRVGLWRVAGNAISPVLAAEVIGAFMEVHP